MRIEDKAKYKEMLEKAEQHLLAADLILKEKSFDAVVSNSCLALINYLDALSINRFGQNLGSVNHSAAPALLQKKLNGIGIGDFKALQKSCTKLLGLKNQASYQSRKMTKKEAIDAVSLLKRVKLFIEDKIDRKVS